MAIDLGAELKPTSKRKVLPEDADLEVTVRHLVADELGRILHARSVHAREVMTAEQVAEFLGVNQKTVYDGANRGHLPHQRLGKRLLFSRSALMAWLGSCKAAEFQKGT